MIAFASVVFPEALPPAMPKITGAGALLREYIVAVPSLSNSSTADWSTTGYLLVANRFIVDDTERPTCFFKGAVIIAPLESIIEYTDKTTSNNDSRFMRGTLATFGLGSALCWMVLAIGEGYKHFGTEQTTFAVQYSKTKYLT
jgi:hypothetical protein